MRRLLAELAYRGEVFCSRVQGIAYDCPERNGEYLLVRRLSDTTRQAIDIGANIGGWTAEVVRATRNVAQVLCVEPDPLNAKALRARFNHESAVRVIEVALSDRTGTAAFAAGDGVGSGVGYIDHGRHDSVQVQTFTLQDIVSDLGDPEIDLVKCDVEGEEMAVLMGGAPLFRRSRIAVMQVEYNTTWHRSGRSLRELFEFAGDHHYRILVATPMGFANLPSYGIGLEDYRLRNIVLAREDRVHRLAPFGPAGRARVEHARNLRSIPAQHKTL